MDFCLFTRTFRGPTVSLLKVQLEILKFKPSVDYIVESTASVVHTSTSLEELERRLQSQQSLTERRGLNKAALRLEAKTIEIVFFSLATRWALFVRRRAMLY